MKIFALFALLLSAFVPSPTLYAAIEYIRVEGSVSVDYGESTFNYDPAYGLQAGQSVYFDFTIDTDASPAISPWPTNDGVLLLDNFLSSYTAGSVANYGDAFGSNINYVEGVVTWLFIQDNLRIGTVYEDLPQVPGESGDVGIDTWEIGTQLDLLLANREFSSIGRLEVTYRELTAPPTYVPVPGAFLLFTSAITAYLGARAKATSFGISSAFGFQNPLRFFDLTVIHKKNRSRSSSNMVRFREAVKLPLDKTLTRFDVRKLIPFIDL